MKIHKHTRFAGACFVLVLLSLWGYFPAFAAEQERILSFESKIRVQPDASVLVWEKIQIYCAGKKIRRGIFRKIITSYRGGYGLNSGRTLRVLQVLRDGIPESYHLETEGDSTTIYFGKKDVLLDHGVYTYEVRYTLNDMVGFFSDHDELYWNVTGNNWEFPIEKTDAFIILPPGVQTTRYKSYTGPSGSTTSTAKETLRSEDEIAFNVSKPLSPGEGLTIVVTWPKGAVTEPALSTRFWERLNANISSLIALLGVAGVFLFYFTAWLLVGRDPAKGTIVPFFKPPKGFSPAAVRLVMQMLFDNTCFTTAILNMAVKGFLRIEEKDSIYTLIKTGNNAVSLSHGEACAAKALFSEGDTLPLEKEFHQRINSGVDALKESLKREYQKAYFRLNLGYFLFGLLLTISTLVAVVLSLPDSETRSTAAFLTLWLSIWSVGCGILIAVFIKTIQKGAIGGVIVSFLFALPFLGGEAVGLWFLASTTNLATVILLLLLWVMIPLFYQLLKAPTYAGRRVMDEIEGFKMFLAIGEQERLNLLHPPSRTPELWEHFLPYALALGVDNEWAEQFSSVLRGAAEDKRGYSPSWYTGTHAVGVFSAGTFAASIGSSLTNAVSASTPSSSSGMSGSSGGGGGGGGGGGW